MAKYNATLSNGAKVTFNIVGPEKDRARKLEWLVAKEEEKLEREKEVWLKSQDMAEDDEGMAEMCEKHSRQLKHSERKMEFKMKTVFISVETPALFSASELMNFGGKAEVLPLLPSRKRVKSVCDLLKLDEKEVLSRAGRGNDIIGLIYKHLSSQEDTLLEDARENIKNSYEAALMKGVAYFFVVLPSQDRDLSTLYESVLEEKLGISDIVVFSPILEIEAFETEPHSSDYDLSLSLYRPKDSGFRGIEKQKREAENLFSKEKEVFSFISEKMLKSYQNY